MSIQAINWAFGLPAALIPNPTDNHVLVVLANYANEDNIAYPSNSSLQRITKLDRSTIKRSLRRLEKAAAITKVNAHNIDRKYRADRLPQAYRLNRPAQRDSSISQ